MHPKTAKDFIETLDAIECDMRHLEARLTSLRRILQNEFRVKCWDYDPTTRYSKPTTVGAVDPADGVGTT